MGGIKEFVRESGDEVGRKKGRRRKRTTKRSRGKEGSDSREEKEQKIGTEN